jgi:hypothetical protein
MEAIMGANVLKFDPAGIDIEPDPHAGPKYNPSRNLRDTAKLVRADIKAAIARGHLPSGKYSVRIDRYSMGQSMDVSIADLPFVVVNRARVEADIRSPHTFNPINLYSEVGAEIIRRVERIVGAYNRQDIDSMTDYYNVHFSSHVKFDWQWEKVQRDAIAAQVR